MPNHNVALNLDDRVSPVLQGILVYLDAINASFAKTQDLIDSSGISMSINFAKGTAEINDFSVALADFTANYESEFAKVAGIALQSSLEISNQINLNLDFSRVIHSVNDLKREIIPVLSQIAAAMQRAESKPDPSAFESALALGKKVKEVYDITNTFGKIMKEVTGLFPGFSAAAGTMGTSSAAAAVGVKTLSGALLANPLFWGAAALAGITALIYAFSSFKDNVYQANDAITEQTEKLKQLQDQYDAMQIHHTNAVADIAGDRYAAEQYVKIIEDLGEKESLTQEETNLLHLAINSINSIYPELGLMIDNTTGKLNMNTNALRNNIAAMEDLALAAAYQSRLIDLNKNKLDAEKSVRDIQQMIDEQEPALKQAIETMRPDQDWGNFKRNVDGKHIDLLAEIEPVFAANELQQQLEKAQKLNADLDREKTFILNEYANLNTVPTSDSSLDPLSDLYLYGEQNLGFKVSGGRIDSVGRIDDEISIAEEDMKVMVDLVSQGYHISYAQVTPQMTVNFGDVRETADVYSIMTVLEDMADEAMQSQLIGGAS